MSREPFIWNEIEHWTLLDLMETLQLIDGDEEAESFFTAFSEVCGPIDEDEIATHNIRYIVDILSRGDEDNAQEEAERLAELFQVDLPSEGEVLAPTQLFGNSSCGVKKNEKQEAEA